MNFILYILLFSFLHLISSEEESHEEDLIARRDEYDILQFTRLSTVTILDEEDVFSAVKFDGPKVFTLPIADVSLSNTTISSPFMLYTKFKLEEPSCLFSIVDKSIRKLSLCFTPAGSDTIRITLYANEEQIDFEYGSTFTDWTKMLLHVKDKNVTLHLDCEPVVEPIKTNLEDIYFSSDAVVHFGMNDDTNYFKGGVEIIKLFTNSEDQPDFVMNCTKEEDEYPAGGYEPVKGEKGEKGDRGDEISGPPGPEGPPGSLGEKGTCSCSESVVSSLVKSMPDMRGPKGDEGLRGAKGDTGEPGKMGKQGDIGERGPEGLQGKPGEKGDLGPMGPRGLPGPPGPPGEAYKEIDKAKGVPVPGKKGDIGPEGPPGKVGEKGEKGQQGVKGEKGDKGNHGPEGPQGERGKRGETGHKGPSGDPGKHGNPGIQGDRGEKGDKGSLGSPGLPASLHSLLDPKMDPVENAAIIEKIRGHKGEIGSKGDKGDKGDAGLPGSNGKDGRHGSHGKAGPKGDTGPRGYKGEPGIPGPPGNVSAAEITLIKGPKGDSGSPGIPGKDGAQGPRGNDGKNGAPGPAGPKGPKGDTGAMGPRGPPGTVGLTGKKGEKGDNVLSSIDTAKLKGEKGDRGNDGRPGENGKPGAPGKCTDSCKAHIVEGLPGPPGPPGPPGNSVIGPKGEPGGIISEKTFYKVDGNHNYETLLDDDDDYYSPMTVVFRTVTALIKHTLSTPLGTLAYVLHEKTLLLRVENGWQYIVMGSLIDTRTTTTYRPPPIRIQEPPTKRSPTETAFIRLIALNEPFAGNMLYSNNRTGRTAANLACYQQARDYRVEGNYVAFMTNKIEDLRNLVKIQQDRSLPVVNIHGEALFRSWQDMFNGSGAPLAKSANIYSFNGKNVFIDPTWPKKAVWHGGNLYGYRSLEAFCDEWQSDSPHHVGMGSTMAYNKLIRPDKFSCDNKLIVLCVEATASRRRRRHSTWRREHSKRAQPRRLNRL